jgi:hypothetical protein
MGIFLFVILWALVVVGSRLMGHYLGVSPDLCLFHRFTGEPCPTCGTTRGLLALARGAWRESFLWNPMTMIGGWLIGMVLTGRMLTGKMVDVELAPMERRIFWGLGLTLFAVNWAWLMYSHP